MLDMYYVYLRYRTSTLSQAEPEVVLLFLLLASAMLQLGWSGYLYNAIRPRVDFSRMEFFTDFSRMEFNIPESELIEEEEEEEEKAIVLCD